MNIEEHKHRFAVWAAGRAASVKGCRFTVAQAKIMLEVAGFKPELSTPAKLPLPQAIDSVHRAWREKVINKAHELSIHAITHGVAAKLINIYLKAIFVCGGHHDHPSVQSLHPPIDSILLSELSVQNFGGFQKAWDEARKIRWSKLNSDQYETVIKNIRVSMPNQALWKIEQYWQGHQ